MAAIAIGIGVAAASPAAAARSNGPPIRNPVLLNIGFICKWQARCIRRQEGAMRASLAYVKATRTPAWKVQLCNRNAARNGTRKDWIGFNNCVRNPHLRPHPPKRRTA